jgi:hypothetical protein
MIYLKSTLVGIAALLLSAILLIGTTLWWEIRKIDVPPGTTIGWDVRVFVQRPIFWPIVMLAPKL